MGHADWRGAVDPREPGPLCRWWRRTPLLRSTPDDLRQLGWWVAVHNDYLLDGERYTFWLLTNPEDGTFLKGEGWTDQEALDQIRELIAPQVRCAHPDDQVLAKPCPDCGASTDWSGP